MNKSDFFIISFIILLTAVVGYYMVQEFINQHKRPAETYLQEIQNAAANKNNQGNLIINGGFEDFYGWEKEQASDNLSIDKTWHVCASGSALKILLKKGEQGYLKQTVSLEGGKTYRFSVDFYLQPSLAGMAKPRVSLRFNDESQIDLTSNDLQEAKAGYCQEYQKSFQTSTNIRQAIVVIGAEEEGLIWFDNLSLIVQ